jgi:hypothetical protein
MRQAFHIFKKDVRHLRFEIAIVISVVTAFAVTDARRAQWQANFRTPASTLATILLPLVWWALIARLVHSEALAGNRQFWITRPYAWRSLLGAKVLFILAFINLPMLVADMVIVRAYGFSLGAELAGLLWSQVLLTVVFVLPIFALSALTTGFVQLIYVILGPIVLSLAFLVVSPRLAFIGFAGGIDWFKSYFAYLVVGAAASVILFWQYSRRRTTLARGLAVAAAILVIAGFTLIPRSAALTIQSRLSKENVDVSSIHAVPDFGRKLLSPADNGWVTTWAFRRGSGTVGIQILYQVLGLSPNAIGKIGIISVGFQASDGSTSMADGYAWGVVSETDHEYFLQTSLDPSFSKKAGEGPLNVHVSLYLTIFGNQQTTRIPFEDPFVQVPRVGVCSPRENPYMRDYQVFCNSAFQSSTALVSFHSDQPSVDSPKQSWSLAQRRLNIFSPFPADLGISPIEQVFSFSSGRIPSDQAVIDTMEPLAHIRLDFDVTNLHVNEFHARQQPITH